MKKLIAEVLTGASLVTAPLPVSALVIDINTYLSGNPVGSNITVARLTLSQNGNSVDFNFQNSVSNLGAIGDDAFISRLLFSYEGSALLKNSSFGNFGGTQLVRAAEVYAANPEKGASYNFYFDLNYSTGNRNPSLRFTDGEYSTWTVSAADGASAVLVSDFAVLLNAGGDDSKPASLAMVDIQQIGAGPGGSGSLKYAGSETNIAEKKVLEPVTPVLATPPQEIPEPATIILLGLGLVGIGLTSRRKK